MAYLLDTHTILWSLENEKRLSNKAKEIIQDPTNECFLSIASFFEMAIKRKIGKLELTQDIKDYVAEVSRIGIKILPIKPSHLDAYEIIPLIPEHRDPFDRLLIATALAENLIVVTDDDKFEWYGNFIQTIW